MVGDGRRPPLPPSRRAWGCGFGRRAWRYGMRAHSTFGQHRGQCSPAFRAAGVVWKRLFSDRSASVGHCPLCCPSVVASTHSIPAPRLPLPSVPHSALSRVKMNSVPTPSVLITLMFWLWALMISLTIDSPSPVPLRSFPREASIL